MGNPISEHELEALTRYVVGEMSAAEKQAFEQQLEQSEALRDEYEVLRSAVEVVRGEADDATALTADRREAVALAAHHAVPSRRSPFWIPLAAAAVVLLTAYLAVQQGGSDNVNPVDEVSRVGEGLDPRSIENAVMDDFGLPGAGGKDRDVKVDYAARAELEDLKALGYADPSTEDGESHLSAQEFEKLRSLGYLSDESVTPKNEVLVGESLGRAEDPALQSFSISTATIDLPAKKLEELAQVEQQLSKSVAGTEPLSLLATEQTARAPEVKLKGFDNQYGSYKGPGDSPPPTTITGVAATGGAREGEAPVTRSRGKQVTTGGGGGGPTGGSTPPAATPPASRAPARPTSGPATPAPTSPAPVTRHESSAGFVAGRTAGNEPAGGETTFGENYGYYFDTTGAGEPVELVFGATLGLAQTPTEVAQLELALGELVDADRDPDREQLDAGQLVDQVLSRLSRHPGETPDMMFFRYWGDNPSVQTRLDALSTFALDVDTASFTLVRNYLSKALLPPKAAVRTEEFVNAFDYGLAPPTDETDVFAIHTELGPSPFGSRDMKLLRVGLKAREVADEERKPVALTFVIDVSGSMDRENRIELVKQSLKLLVLQLDERDTIGIVTFQSTAQQVLAPHSMQHRQLILAAIDSLHANGSTNAGDGLKLGFQMALAQFNDEGENRILLCSDGVANTGITDVDGILRSVERYREGRIYLNSVGVGMGNHNDTLLEQLANKGDGFYAYVDTLEEAKRIFVDEMVGTMQTVAGEARAQVEFHPEAVTRYRLLGYENRAVADADFRSTSIDAGEIGAGHEVTALYELECVANVDGPYATVRVFSQDPDSNEWVEQAQDVSADASAGELGMTSPQFRLAASVAEFAEILRQSIWSRGGSFGEVLTVAEPLVREIGSDGDVAEFVALVRQASRLPDLLPPRTELTRTLDELKRNQHLKAMLDDLKSQQDDQLLQQIESQNDDLERKIRQLMEQRLRGDC